MSNTLLDYPEGGSKNEELSLNENCPVHLFEIVLYDGTIRAASCYMTKEDLHHSKLLSISVENDLEVKEIPLMIDKTTNLNTYTFIKAMDYLKRHRNEKISIPDRPLGLLSLEEIWKDPWDVQFINDVYLDSKFCDRLYELMNAANYLDINPLIHLVGTKLAHIINQTDPSKLHKELGLQTGSYPS
jgi:hypothetical protein